MPRYCQIGRLSRLPDFPTPTSPIEMFKIGARVYFKSRFRNTHYTSAIICSLPKQTGEYSYSYEVLVDLQDNQNFEPDDYVKLCVDAKYLSLNDVST